MDNNLSELTPFRLLKPGIPKLSDYLDVIHTPLFKEIEHASNEFKKTIATEYINKFNNWPWPLDPLHTWSRQWEYPFCVAHLKHWNSDSTTSSRHLLADIGSGFSFLPRYLHEIGIDIICCDSDTRLKKIYKETGQDKYCHIDILSLPDLGYENKKFDAITCISVLEHLPKTVIPATIKEIFRILKPGGLFILTFDLHLDNQTSVLTIDQANILIELLSLYFSTDLSKIQEELREIQQHASKTKYLTTNWILDNFPGLLPWRPTIGGIVKQLIRFKIPQRPFRSLSICCLALRKPQSQ